MSQPIAKLACNAPFHANLLLWYLTAPMSDIRLCDVQPKARLDDDVRTRVCIWAFKSLKTTNFDDTTMAVLRHYADCAGGWWAACDILQENSFDLWGYRRNVRERVLHIPYADVLGMVREHILHTGATSSRDHRMLDRCKYPSINETYLVYNYAICHILPVA